MLNIDVMVSELYMPDQCIYSIINTKQKYDLNTKTINIIFMCTKVQEKRNKPGSLFLELRDHSRFIAAR